MNKFNLRKDHTQEELDFLESVGFPTYELKQNKAVQRRTIRSFANGGYFNKQIIEAKDLIYMIMPTHIVKKQLGYKAEAEKQAKDRGLSIDSMNKHLSFISDYLFLPQLQAEADRLCRLYCTPKATPSMSAAKEVVVEPTLVEEAVKGLSNTHKSAAKKLYEESKDSAEIAEALGVDEKRVIEYLKKLS